MSSVGSGLLDIELFVLELTLVILTTYHCYKFILYTTNSQFNFSRYILQILTLIHLQGPKTSGQQISEKLAEEKQQLEINSQERVRKPNKFRKRGFK